MVLAVPLAILLGLTCVTPKGEERREYKLATARISESRGQNLEIKLVPADGKGDDVVLRFPAHSLTPHERKLKDAVRAAVTFDKGGHHEWTPVRGRLVFTLPTRTLDKRHTSKELWDTVRLVADPEAKK